MTREEAIRFANYAQDMEKLQDVKEFYALAEAALREQEERERGCEYCNGLPFSQMEDFTMPNASKKDYDIVTIRYCPICGRRFPQPPKGE